MDVRKSQEDATKAAQALAAQLGAGWTSEVWENLGWHYAAISPCGRWKIHASRAYNCDKPDSYTAFLGETDSPGGYWAETAATPEEAIKKTINVARAEVEHRASFLDLVCRSKYASG
jgi:hypothetical protein